MTVQKILTGTVKTIIHLRKTTKSPIHALIYGKWGTGKSYSAQRLPHVFYAKVPDGQVSKSRIVKILALALGSGYRNLYEGTLDLMKYHVLEKGIKHPIFILDEAQRVLKSSLLMSELKDLSEDVSLNFSYIFLGDHTTPKVFQAHPHSLHKRILIKKELEPLAEDMVKELAKDHQLDIDIKTITSVGKEKGWTTIDVAFLFSYLKPLLKEGKIKEITEETIHLISRKLGV